MMRLILFVFLAAAVFLAFASFATALRSFAEIAPRTQEDTMPKTFQRVAYVLLIVLLFGITSGWLGAA